MTSSVAPPRHDASDVAAVPDAPALPAPAALEAEPGVRPFCWTLDRYHLAIERDVLGPDDKVQLIEGKIVELAPFKPPHVAVADLARNALREAFGPGFYIKSQTPLGGGGTVDGLRSSVLASTSNPKRR